MRVSTSTWRELHPPLHLRTKPQRSRLLPPTAPTTSPTRRCSAAQEERLANCQQSARHSSDTAGSVSDYPPQPLPRTAMTAASRQAAPATQWMRPPPPQPRRAGASKGVQGLTWRPDCRLQRACGQCRGVQECVALLGRESLSLMLPSPAAVSSAPSQLTLCAVQTVRNAQRELSFLRFRRIVQFSQPVLTAAACRQPGTAM
jgi:hypothetical protein